MARLDSFYLPPPSWGQNPRLEGDEAHHLTKVLRLAPGATVRCFDGLGREGLFTVAGTKGGVKLARQSSQEALPRRLETWLALGWNKSARRGWLLEKAVELDCAGILFWESTRSQGHMPAAAKDAWQGQLIAGAKQCGNPWLPTLAMAPGGVDALIEQTKDFQRRWLLWESPDVRRGLTQADIAMVHGPGNSEAIQVGEGGGGSGTETSVAGSLGQAAACRQIFVLGPEGGITDHEAARLQEAGFTAVTLGPRPLRWETAALLCLGLAWWSAQPGETGETDKTGRSGQSVQADAFGQATFPTGNP